jgi:hypothetical protein
MQVRKSKVVEQQDAFSKMERVDIFRILNISTLRIKLLEYIFFSYQAIVKSTITYAAETLCLKANEVAKLNSTEMDFWRRSARISRKDKIRNTVIKQRNECNKKSFRRY